MTTADSVFWYVEVEWADGTIEEIGRFSSVSEAHGIGSPAIQGIGSISGPGLRNSIQSRRRAIGRLRSFDGPGRGGDVLGVDLT
jgi:hypothetical protein